MKKIINRIRTRYTLWRNWRMYYDGGFMYKLLVFAGLRHSPIFELELSVKQERNKI